jgi:hypothetical protein
MSVAKETVAIAVSTPEGMTQEEFRKAVKRILIRPKKMKTVAM